MGKPSKVNTLEPVTEYIGYVEEENKLMIPKVAASEIGTA